MPTAEQALCRLDEIPDGHARGLLRDGPDDRVFALRRGAAVHVYINSCPHDRRPLEYLQDRFLSADGARIVCYAHGAQFEPDTGLCVHGPCAGASLVRVPSRVSDGRVFVPAVLPAGP